MPHSTNETPAGLAQPEPRKLVLCFDGTGNVFQGDTSDTNIVKLYDKFDRKDLRQYHYYQTGIGTYSVDGGPVNKTIFGRIQSYVSKTIDSGFATTFNAHVIGGYRFIMKYYKEGDKIYMFGFSRGAFTARFLARMIYKVGLLSEGNEEMVPFAYDLYQQYELGKMPMLGQPQTAPVQGSGLLNKAATSTETDPLHPKGANADDYVKPDEQQQKREKLNAFKATFCRSESADNSSIKVHFLGIFDCTLVPVSVAGTAHHVRHAVAVDEHRVKFKAALLHQDNKHTSAVDEDIKEVWFPGNHGDVGGGWPAPPHLQGTTDKTSDPYQMSDVPLAWMIRELELVGERDKSSAIKWSDKKTDFKTNLFKKLNEAYNSPMHDTLAFGGGSSRFKVMLWNLMEWLPFRRWELQWNKQDLKYKWAHTRSPLNKGSARDIPDGALLHDSLLKRLRSEKHSITGQKHSQYSPSNNRGDGGDDTKACLESDKFILQQEDKGATKKTSSDVAEPSGIHNIYTLRA